MSTFFKSLKEGFVGAFRLAGAIIMAIIAVSSAFANNAPEAHAGPDKSLQS